MREREREREEKWDIALPLARN
jgi:hypothetical protein